MPVPAFDLDMGFSVEDIAEGLGSLLRNRSMPSVSRREGAEHVVFETQLDGFPARIDVCPMPEERRSPFAFPPRSLLVLESDAPAAAVEEFRQAVLFAFLRVAG